MRDKDKLKAKDGMVVGEGALRVIFWKEFQKYLLSICKTIMGATFLIRHADYSSLTFKRSWNFLKHHFEKECFSVLFTIPTLVKTHFSKVGTEQK